MAFSMTLTPAQQDLVERTHRFAEEVIRPVADHYDREEEFPWPVLEAAAQEGFYNPSTACGSSPLFRAGLLTGR
jgi:acyl-CoA dehydrogenase